MAEVTAAAPLRPAAMHFQWPQLCTQLHIRPEPVIIRMGNAAVVKDLAGHAAIRTTQKYYTRVLPEALRSAPERLPFGGVIRRSICRDSAHGPQSGEKEEAAKIISLDRFRA